MLRSSTNTVLVALTTMVCFAIFARAAQTEDRSLVLRREKRDVGLLNQIHEMLYEYQQEQEEQEEVTGRRWGSGGGSYWGGDSNRPGRPNRWTRPSRRSTTTRQTWVQRPQPQPQPSSSYSSPESSSSGGNGGGSGGDACDQAFQAAIQSQQNMYRNRHHAASLGNSNPTSKSWAKRYAKELSDSFRFAHNPQLRSLGLGENLYRKMSSRPFSRSASACAGYAKSAVDAWYEEISMYNFGNPGFTSETGHFTALVWKSTNDAGHGLAFSASSNPSNGYYYLTVVSNYSPPGNVQGRFQSEVLRA